MYFAVGKPALTKIPAKVISARRGARTHDPEIKSLMLYRLSQPGTKCITPLASKTFASV